MWKVERTQESVHSRRGGRATRSLIQGTAHFRPGVQLIKNNQHDQNPMRPVYNLEPLILFFISYAFTAPKVKPVTIYF